MSEQPTSRAPEIISVSIGHLDKAIHLSILKLPPTTSPVSAKAQAFDFALQALHPHSGTFDFGEKTAFFLALAPRSIGTALSEAQAFGTLLRDQIFSITNLKANAFLYGTGTPVEPTNIFCPIAERALNIAMFSVTSTINPTSYAPDGVTLPSVPFSVVINLTLPQLASTQATASATSATTPTTNLLTQLEAVAQIKTLADLSNDVTTVGTADGNDVLTDYAPDVLLQLSATCMQHLFTRSINKVSSGDPPTATTLPTTPASLSAIVTTPVTASTTTFIGDVDFLESQDKFNKTFPQPKPAGLTGWETTVSINKFIDMHQFRVFHQLVRANYIGSSDCDTNRATQDVITDIRRLCAADGPWRSVAP